MKIALPALAVGLLCLAAQPAAHAAAVVQYDTLVQNDTQWVTNGYGTVGYVFPTANSSGDVTTSGTITYTTSSKGATISSSITLESPPTITLSYVGNGSLSNDSFYKNITFTFHDGSPDSVRVAAGDNSRPRFVRAKRIKATAARPRWRCDALATFS